MCEETRRLDLCLGPAGLLKVADVELLLSAHLREDLAGPRPAARGIRTLSSPTARKTSGLTRAELGGDGCAPVVAHDHCRLLAQGVHHGDVVLDQLPALSKAWFEAMHDAMTAHGIDSGMEAVLAEFPADAPAPEFSAQRESASVTDAA
jgi:hypothetical protein